ncbi:MAG: FAD-dependent oxidoreductase [Myxococcales bacterium]|nr:FAD-dependent oxidoreductase [Myxococcales bacterium]
MTSNIGSAERPLAVAIVGSGPAGFYLAQPLLKQRDLDVRIDMFDRLPTPYGLVRGGVAPDHQSIKAVTRVYDKLARDERVRFFGNVTIGSDVTLDELRAHYDVIAFAVGNEASRRLGIPGEALRGSSAAAVFVGWYNGHPDYREAEFDFSARRVVVVGNGNVSIDVARILARCTEELSSTDIAEHALSALRESDVREIVVMGRRGPAQAAFTPAELRELTRLSKVDVLVERGALELDAQSAAFVESDPRVTKNIEQLRELGQWSPGDALPEAGGRRIVLRFLCSPVEILGDEQTGRVRAVELERNRLVSGGDAEGDYMHPEPTGERETVDAEMVLYAIGYRGRRLPGVPFDEHAGRIPNVDGRITGEDGKPLGDLYVVGWARSGPKGLIGTHKKGSAEVAERILDDVRSGAIPARDLLPLDDVSASLRARGASFVTFADWLTLDAIEVEKGQERGAVRHKVADVDEMLELIRQR